MTGPNQFPWKSSFGSKFEMGHAQKHGGLIRILFHLRKESGLKVDLRDIICKDLNGLNLLRIESNDRLLVTS
jgi:hypothetical protein